MTGVDSTSSLFTHLAAELPAFPVASEKIKILASPDEFYTTLCNLIDTAEQRVCLSSLYLGTGPHEHHLVELLRSRLATRPELSTHVVLDYLRGTRPVDAAGHSSLTTLRPLLTAGSRVSIDLVHVPPPKPPTITPIRFWLEERYMTGRKTREARGVHHIKVYIVDNKVIVSGSEHSAAQMGNCNCNCDQSRSWI